MNLGKKNTILRRLLIGVLIVACISLAGLFVYLQAVPKIIVINQTDHMIDEVEVELPSSRVVFDGISPGKESTILYSARQSDGAYQYSVRFFSDQNLTGECGDVTSTQFGKRLTLIVRGLEDVECRESQRLF